MQTRHLMSTRARIVSATTVAIAAGITLAGCSGSGTPLSSPSPKEPTTATAQPTGVVASGQLGKPVTVGSFTYTIESVKPVGATLSSAEGESMAQGEFVVMKMKVKNNATSKERIAASDFSAVTANSQAVEAQENDSVIVNGKNPAFRSGIAAGQTADVALVFDFSPAPTTPVSQIMIKDSKTGQTVAVQVA